VDQLRWADCSQAKMVQMKNPTKIRPLK
jgi:hypothetical protein